MHVSISPNLATNWWALLIRGIAALMLGLAAFLVPGVTFAVLVLMFGAYALVNGIFCIAAAVREGSRHEPWWPMILNGIVGIALGLYTALRPGVTAFALLFAIGIWAIVTGVFEIAAAIRLRKKIRGEWLLIAAGAASLVLGVLLLWAPAAGAVALVWWLGSYAVLFGVLLIAVAFEVRAGDRTYPARPEALAA